MVVRQLGFSGEFVTSRFMDSKEAIWRVPCVQMWILCEPSTTPGNAYGVL